MTVLEAATAQNAQYNLIYNNAVALRKLPFSEDSLKFQHLQFRRVEKFMKNYLDVGKVVQERIGETRILQRIEFFDKSAFLGEFVQEEESKAYYKEGQGKLLRPPGNLSFINKVQGTWVRGTMHCKKMEFVMNPKVWPSGYTNHQKVDSLSIVQEVKKGVWNGNGEVWINKKKVCKTKFHDLVEIINSWVHPVGRHNHISTDLAALNCLMNVSVILCFCFVGLEGWKEFFITLGVLFYLG